MIMSANEARKHNSPLYIAIKEIETEILKECRAKSNTAFISVPNSMKIEILKELNDKGYTTTETQSLISGKNIKVVW